MTARKIVGNLYIGDLEDAQTADYEKFDHIIGVTSTDLSDEVECEYTHFNLADGPATGYGEYSYELLSEAIDAVVAARIRRQTVMVHCTMGISRSATVAAAALAVLKGLEFEEALEKVEKVKPNVNPLPILRDDARRYLDEHQ